MPSGARAVDGTHKMHSQAPLQTNIDVYRQALVTLT
jgi:hypothetical protein